MKLELTPRESNPVLPFPRVVGKDIVSPFKGGLREASTEGPSTSRMDKTGASIDLTFGKDPSTTLSIRRNLNH